MALCFHNGFETGGNDLWSAQSPTAEQLAQKLFCDYVILLFQGIVLEPEHLVDAWLRRNVPKSSQSFRNQVMELFWELCYDSACEAREYHDCNDEEDEDWGLFEDGNIFKDY